MDTFKIEHFEREHPGIEFPWFRELKLHETAEIRDRLSQRIGLPAGLDNLELTRSVSRLCSGCESKNAESQLFNLMNLTKDLGITPQGKVYVNWYRYDKIDQMAFEDLVRYFDDIWYPSSDDIELFDDSLSWIVAVSHYGNVSAWKA